MNIQLIQGTFSTKDAIDLISKMIQIKIMYHENKIAHHSSEEDIKYRESKIKKLQKELYEFRKNFDDSLDKLNIDAVIKLK